MIRPLIAVLGPTASGKSGLAEGLAERHGAELVNADASALYRELQVGVTKPDRATRERLPYHLLDVADLNEGITVIDYQRLAEDVLRNLARRAVLPILVGGSNLFVKALLEGYLPPPVEVPELLRQRVREMTLEGAVEELSQRDPAFLARIDARNPRRVARALELVLAHGGPVAPPSARPLAGWAVLRLILLPDKKLLAERIQRRTEEMWEPWLEEVIGLEKKALRHWLEVRRPIGYDTVRAHLEGRVSRAEAIAQIVRATVLLAKKQRTWLQKDTEGPDRHLVVWNAESDWEEVSRRAQAAVDGFLARFTE